MNKHELREKMKQKRSELNSDFVERASEIICKRFPETKLYAESQTIAVYMAIKNEVNLDRLITKALSDGKRVCVPVINPDTDDIYLSEITSADRFKQGLFGISEPEKIKKINPGLVDLMLVPGLCFNFSGARIGWGKGYYDRLNVKTNAALVGVAYEFQLCGTVDTEPHDVKMNYIITESEMVVCG